MVKETFDQFAMPKEMRAFVEQSVTQAKRAFDGFILAANQAMQQFQSRAQAAGGSANEITHKSMEYAEQNMAAAFDFTQKLIAAKDGAEVMRLQSEYLGRQMQALSAQVQELGQSAANIAMDAAKPKP